MREPCAYLNGRTGGGMGGGGMGGGRRWSDWRGDASISGSCLGRADPVLVMVGLAGRCKYLRILSW